MSVILQLDAGELPDESEVLWSLFDVLAIACGGHAGDASSMARVVASCAGHLLPEPGSPPGPASPQKPPIPRFHPSRSRVGAHPSYPDRANFGRLSLDLSPAALAASIAEQCAALAAIARAHELAVDWVKPHGALYHDAAAHEPIARALLDGACSALGDHFTVIGPPRGALRDAAESRGLGYAREGFADRGRRPDGSLIPRGEPGALITDRVAAAAQARALLRSGEVDAICVHADTPGALAIARAIRTTLGETTTR
jgi:UPF0271 protein